MIFIPPIATSYAQATRKAKRKGQSSDSGFSGYISDAEEAAPPPQSVATDSIASSNPLLGLQEISDDSLNQKQAMRHAHNSLDLLEDIRLSLMCGGIPLAMLHHIDDLVAKERKQQPNPELQEILDEIDVRVAVERAKLEMALHSEGG